MTRKLDAIYFSASLALSLFLTRPVLADEGNKRVEFQFSVPVEIPGRVLAPGKYVFELLNSNSDSNMVQIFSEGSDGSETPIATVLAIPENISNIPDKPTVHFDERRAGAPEAIHSWFYPGDDTGWQFVYPQGESLKADANRTPDPAPAAAPAAAAASTMPEATDAQQVSQIEDAPEVALVEEPLLIAQNDAPAQLPAPETDIQSSDAQVLPQTGGNSDLELITGFVMFGSGLTALFANRRKSASKRLC